MSGFHRRLLLQRAAWACHVVRWFLLPGVRQAKLITDAA
jgi:hypothetical protein